MKMPFWDNFHMGRPDRQDHHNLQEGLFQIASQTCSLLVQVNNTNNISYGNNAVNVHHNNFNPNQFCSTRPGPSSTNGYRPVPTRDQSVILIPARSDGVGINRNSKNFFSHYRHRLSTVLEHSSTPAVDDDFDLYEQNQMLQSQNAYNSRWNRNSWCKPSCIPITVILTLIVLVVLLPLLEHQTDKVAGIKNRPTPYLCPDQCNIQLVESIPEGLRYNPDSPSFMSTFDAWSILLEKANVSLDIASFYWTLRGSDVYNHSSAQKGEQIFQSILNAGTRSNKIKIRIAQSAPTQDQPNLDTELLARRKAATVRSVNFPKLIGGGVLHTKLWIVDGIHMYIGSANMDWRSLTQVKEMGVLLQNCSCLVEDVSNIFSVYWDMGREGAHIPPSWPTDYNTKFNITRPISVNFNESTTFNTYLSSSPPQMSPIGRAQDIDAIVDVILDAEKFVYVAVMDYYPLTIYSPKMQYWPIIDNALRTAALENKVSIKLLISWWNHSRPAEDFFLRSLDAISESYRGVSIEIKRFVVPTSEDQSRIPYARVNHNKYMVTDRVAYIGTSNWSGDYFINTAGIGLVMQNNETYLGIVNRTIRTDLVGVFLRDWNSAYAVDLIK